VSDDGFEAQTLAWLALAATRATPPRVRALHLPPARPGDELAGESCALELEDGSLGLSYVLFGDTLPALRDRSQALIGADAMALAAGCSTAAGQRLGLDRTLGFAALNALTAWFYRRTGYTPPAAGNSLASLQPQPGEAVGMIGWFPPLVPQLLARGAQLTVIELREDLHGQPQPGVRVSGNAKALAECTQVLSTATVLLNGSFDRMRAACGRARRFALVGPSAGMLPDALFERGVDTIGGSWIIDAPGFVQALCSGAPRGASARKFEIDKRSYPGASALMARF
jgi:uncharacterized protein (DUF4213/DUF364 family)